MIGTDRKGALIDQVQGFVVQQVIPEHLIVVLAPTWASAEGQVPAAGFTVPSGAKHVGQHTFMLTEVGGKTVVTALMQHAYHYGPAAREKWRAALAKRVQDARDRKAANTKDKWETAFEPKLRELVEGN
jgi:hypothetical protein